jgi:hypothetical protein
VDRTLDRNLQEQSRERLQKNIQTSNFNIQHPLHKDQNSNRIFPEKLHALRRNQLLQAWHADIELDRVSLRAYLDSLGRLIPSNESPVQAVNSSLGLCVQSSALFGTNGLLAACVIPAIGILTLLVDVQVFLVCAHTPRPSVVFTIPIHSYDLQMNRWISFLTAVIAATNGIAMLQRISGYRCRRKAHARGKFGAYIPIRKPN